MTDREKLAACPFCGSGDIHQAGDAEEVKEAAAKIARDYASKARNRGWPTAPDSAAKAADHIAAAIRAMPVPTSTDKVEAFKVVPCVNKDGHRTSWDICYPPEPDASGVGVVASCYGTFEQAHTMAAALNTKGAKP